MRNFRDLRIWQLGMELANKTFELTKSFPDDEKFGLVSQLNRAAVSVPANIAEGCGRETNKDFKRFLSIALGSLYEVETLLELSRLRDYDETEKIHELIESNKELQKRMVSMFRNISD